MFTASTNTDFIALYWRKWVIGFALIMLALLTSGCATSDEGAALTCLYWFAGVCTVYYIIAAFVDEKNRSGSNVLGVLAALGIVAMAITLIFTQSEEWTALYCIIIPFLLIVLYGLIKGRGSGR